MKKIVVVRVLGGLGNQLFCYSAARRLALVNDAELVIDDSSGFAYDHVYQRKYQLDHFNILCRKATAVERFEPFSRVRRFIKRSSSQMLPFVKRTYIQQEGVRFEPRLLEIQLKGNVYIEGYWQSEGYFKDMESTIRQDLQIKPPNDIMNLDMGKKMRSCNSVAVHVRFFDSVTELGDNNAPVDYYCKALARMAVLAPDAHYFIFSDKPEDARNRIHWPSDHITLVSHNQGDENAYADLWLMTQCKQFIIANSTFSWWGAWLAANVDKKVIAPCFEMNQGKMTWGFDGLLPNEWIKL